MRMAVQLLIDDLIAAGTVGGGPGTIPVDTQNLRNSLMASTVAPPAVMDIDRDHRLKDPTGDLTAVITGWNPEKETTLWLGWQAAYARRQNYGFVGTDSLGRNYNQGGFFFLEKHAAQWNDYVKRAAAMFGDS